MYKTCDLCKKKTLTYCLCKCGKIFCIAHRIPEIHVCKQLELKNKHPIVMVKLESVKIEKI